MLKRRLGKKVLAAALALALTVSAGEVFPGGGVSVKAASIPEARSEERRGGKECRL